jgi:secreted trypsin-like serine protease
MLSTPRPPRRRVAQIILHPEFLQTTLVNDVALLKLATPIPAASLLPVALNTDAAWELQGVPLVAAGWGVTSEDSQTVSSSLQEVTLGVVRTALLDARCVRTVDLRSAPMHNASLCPPGIPA